MVDINVVRENVSLCAAHGEHPAFGCEACLNSLSIQQGLLSGELTLDDLVEWCDGCDRDVDECICEETEELTTMTVDDVARLVRDMPQAQRELVVHVRHAPYDVYIGRECAYFAASDWGNPIPLKHEEIATTAMQQGVTLDVAEWIVRRRVMRWYVADLLAKPELLARIRELKGKRLGCWCRKPGHDVLCHGLVLAALANRE